LVGTLSLAIFATLLGMWLIEGAGAIDSTSKLVSGQVVVFSWVIASTLCKSQMVLNVRVKLINIISIMMYAIIALWAIFYAEKSAHDSRTMTDMVGMIWVVTWPIVDFLDLTDSIPASIGVMKNSLLSSG
jgi:hypothetical protein